MLCPDIFCFTLVLQAKFKILVSVKEIESDAQIKKTHKTVHNKTLISGLYGMNFTQIEKHYSAGQNIP